VLGLALAATSVAHADPFVELGGGLAIPVSDDEYTSYVDPSVKLVARIGAGGPKLGGMGSVDWTPLAADNSILSFNRFRFMGHIQARTQLAPKVQLVGRFGAGLDLIREHAETTILGVRFEGTDTDLGLALEPAGGVWFAVGSGGTQIGVELALPISYHASKGNPNNPTDPNDAKFDYTSVDIDLLGGVRLGL